MSYLRETFRCLIVLFAASTSACSIQAAEQPNVLFLFADDQAYHTLRALGNEEIETPNLDRLVKNGTTFTNTYNQGGWNGAICVASRAMLNTGLFLWHAHAAEKKLKSDWVPQNRMWAQLMAKAGYQTFFSGKWHVKADPAAVFEVARNIRGGMPNQTEAGYNRPLSRTDDRWKPWDPSFGGFWKGGKHWSEVLGDDGVEYLKIAADDKRPFFMYLAFNAPHDPRQSPKEFVDMYPVDEIAVPASFQPEYPYDIGSNRVRDEKLAPFPRTEYAVQVNRQEYYAIITHMDRQIGRILDALEASGQADNTYIIFTADHGLSCGHHGLLGKQNMFEHSVRVPFVVNGPSIPAGRRIERRIYLQSVMPTSLELAGAETPEHVEFESLLPLLKDETSHSIPVTASPPIYGAYTDTQRMLVQGRHKLILYPKIRRSLLFDLLNDPEEMQDLSETAEAAEIKRSLFAEFLKQQRRIGDSLDVSSAFPELLKDQALPSATLPLPDE